MYSPKASVLYRPMPKVACTSWALVMQNFEGITDQERIRNVSKHDNGVPQLKDFSVWQIARILKDTSVFKFAVVRHPFSRLRSAYNDKIARPTDEGIVPQYKFKSLAEQIKEHAREQVITGMGTRF